MEEGLAIADERPNEDKLHALIKMEVACRLALESLPELTRETGNALREPIERLCNVTECELRRLQPGLAVDPDAEPS